MEKMKAVVCERYGPAEVLKLQEVPKPIPNDNEILIRIYATTAHIGDTKIRSLNPGFSPVIDFFFRPMMRLMLGWKRPGNGILGMDLSGVVEEVGKKVSKLKVGDAVFATAFKKFGFGAYAEFICLPVEGPIAFKPKNISHGEAAALANGALTSLLILRKANIQQNQHVLIYGASGSLGTYAIQLAKYYGAEVTAVCSTTNLAMVKDLGADHVIDYTKEDLNAHGREYDVIYDAVGKLSAREGKRSLKKGGIFLDVMRESNGLKLYSEDLQFLADLCEQGVLKTVVDRSYPLDEMVEAHRYVEQGHKKGNVLINVVDEG